MEVVLDLENFQPVEESLVGICPDDLLQANIPQERFGKLKFFCQGDDLGEYLVATVIDKKGRYISFQKRPDSPVRSFVVSIFEEEHDVFETAIAVLEALAVKRSELIWMKPVIDTRSLQWKNC